MMPAALVASTCSGAPRSRQTAPTSVIGSMVPISLLASVMVTKGGLFVHGGADGVQVDHAVRIDAHD